MKHEPHNQALGNVFILGFEDAEIFYHTETESVFSAMRARKNNANTLNGSKVGNGEEIDRP
jgi:hypothetical protein